MRFKTKRSYTNDPRLPSTAERHFWGFIFGTLSDIHTLPAIGLVSALSRIYGRWDPTPYRHAQSSAISRFSVFDNGSSRIGTRRRDNSGMSSPGLKTLSRGLSLRRRYPSARVAICAVQHLPTGDMRAFLLIRSICCPKRPPSSWVYFKFSSGL